MPPPEAGPAPALAPGPGETISRALDPEVRTPADGVSARVLDAALGLSGRGGLGGLTIDAVAERAGVGRMTVYRRFGDRAGLIDALLVRETRAGLERVSAAVEPSDPVSERIADGFAAALGLARTHPLLRYLSDSEPASTLAILRAPGDPVGSMIRRFLAAEIRRGWDARPLAEERIEQAAELLMRIGVSFLLLPRSAIEVEDPAAARSFARELIAPILS